jgi:hypothetical protein
MDPKERFSAPVAVERFWQIIPPAVAENVVPMAKAVTNFLP